MDFLNSDFANILYYIINSMYYYFHSIILLNSVGSFKIDNN